MTKDTEREKGRRGEGEKGRRGEGEKGRRGEGEKGRRGEGEKGRRGEGEKGRRGEGGKGGRGEEACTKLVLAFFETSANGLRQLAGVEWCRIGARQRRLQNESDYASNSKQKMAP